MRDILHGVTFRMPLDPAQKHAIEEMVPKVTAFSAPPQAKSEAEEIVGVLSRAAEDWHFITKLTADGSRALAEYDLSTPAKAALLSGDLGWIEERVGTLDPQLRTWVDCRLQQEIW